MNITERAPFTLKLDSLGKRIEYYHSAAEQAHRDAVAKLQNVLENEFVVTSGHLDQLIETQAELQVWATLSKAYEHHVGSDLDAKETIDAVLHTASTRALNPWKPNSTINVSVEMDMALHFAWVKAYNTINT